MSGTTTTGADIESGMFHNPAHLSNMKGKKILSGYNKITEIGTTKMIL